MNFKLILKLFAYLTAFLVLAISIVAYRFYYLPWDDSPEVKKQDCEEAILATEFDETVLDSIESFVKLNDYILANFDSIIQNKKTLSIEQSNNMNSASMWPKSFYGLYDEVVKNRLTKIELNSNGTIRYFLHGIDLAMEPRNYYSRHRLVYGARPKLKLKDSVLTSLYKFKSVDSTGKFYYQIVIEPYYGW